MEMVCADKIITESPHAGWPEGDQIAAEVQSPFPVDTFIAESSLKVSKNRQTIIGIDRICVEGFTSNKFNLIQLICISYICYVIRQ